MVHNIVGKFSYKIRVNQSQLDAKINQPITKSSPAFLGDNDGVIDVYNGEQLPAGYVVVRDFNGNLSRAYNQRVPLWPGIGINVGYDPLQPTLFQVLSQRDYLTLNPVIAVPHHHESHEFPGPDTVFTHSEQLFPGLILGNNGFTLTIFPFIYKRQAGDRGYIAYQTLDVSGYVPASGARAFTLAAGDDGTIHVVMGGTQPSPGAITIADFPAMTDGSLHEMWGMRLYAGQMGVQQTSTYTDLFDFRWGGVYGGASTNLSSPYWIISPPKITSQRDDYSPPGYDSTIRLININSDTPQNITGLTGGSLWRRIYFYNNGSQDITFKDVDAGSVAANQFYLWGSDYVLVPGTFVEFQYDTGDFWFQYDSGIEADALLDRVVLTDVFGRQSVLDWLSIKPDQKQIVMGQTEAGIPINGGTALHIIDETGHTGGETFMWAFGIGTGITDGQPDSDFAGRHFFIKGRGTVGVPEGLLDGDLIGEMIGVGYGDNGNYNAASETAQIEMTNRIKISFRAAGDFDDVSRPAKMEVWFTPVGQLEKVLGLTIGGVTGGLVHNSGPEVLYRNTRTNIEALADVEGQFAYATDINAIGSNNGADWSWLTLGAGATSITGGGTLALGGFTLTVPATGTAVLGSGAVSRVAFWSDANTLSSDTGLMWDATNNYLGIFNGTTGTPSYPLHIVKVVNSASTQYGIFLSLEQSGAGSVRGIDFISYTKDVAGNYALNFRGQTEVRASAANSTIGTQASTFNGRFNFYSAAGRIATITNGAVFNADPPFDYAAGGTNVGTNLAGFQAKNQGASFVVNAYGILIDDQTGATSGNYAIRSGAGAVSIQGSMTKASAAGAVWKAIEERAATATITGSTNITTATGFNYHTIAQPILSAASAITISYAATLYITDAPVGAGAGPATITNPYAFWIDNGKARLDGPVDFGAVITIADAVDIIVGTTTGSKIGSAANQKLSIWGVAPIVQPTTAIASATFVTNTSGIVDDSATFDAYTIGQVVKALRNMGALA